MINPHKDAIYAAAQVEGAPDWILSGGEDKRVVAVNWREPERAVYFDGNTKSITSLSYRNVSGKQYVASGGRDWSVRLWNFATGKGLHKFEGHELTVSAVDISADASLVASGSRDTSVRVWDTESGKERFRASIPRNLVTCMKWIPGKSTFAAGAEDLQVRLWDIRSGSVRDTSSLGPYIYFPLAIDVTRDGRYVLTSSKGFGGGGGGGEGRVWDLRNPAKPVQVFHGHQMDATGCAFLDQAYDGAGVCRLATVSKDRSVRIWDRDSGRQLCNHAEINCDALTSLAALSDGSTGDLAATAFNGRTFVYKISADGEEVRTLATSTPIA